jgi:hypothetical protein
VTSTYSKKYLPHIIKIIGRWLSTDKSNLLINYYLYVLISKNQINHHFHMHECVVVFFFFFSHLNHVCIKMAGKIKINSSDVLQKSNRMKDLKQKKNIISFIYILFIYCLRWRYIIKKQLSSNQHRVHIIHTPRLS